MCLCMRLCPSLRLRAKRMKHQWENRERCTHAHWFHAVYSREKNSTNESEFCVRACVRACVHLSMQRIPCVSIVRVTSFLFKLVSP